MQLTTEQLDRAAGALGGVAIGDALGVPYEFGPPLKGHYVPAMTGGGLGGYEPGEWSDDTQMTTVVAAVAATGADLREQSALDAVADGFIYWSANGASDIGMQTGNILYSARQLAEDDAMGSYTPGELLAALSADLHERTGRTAGNGSLMRTVPVALRYLNAPDACAEAARKVSALTHYDPLAGDACAIWCEAIRRTILEGHVPGLREYALPRVLGRSADSKWYGMWEACLYKAEQGQPADFSNNGFVVAALQAAYSAVVPLARRSRVGGLVGQDDVFNALYSAVRAGGDTDTVAAIAGGLVGAAAGFSNLPAAYRGAVHGWAYLCHAGKPGSSVYRADDLHGLAVEITRQA
jgi:ADP-ribosylglycohydrolase